jgi:hypothetical protein
MATFSRPSYSTKSILLRPTTSRTAVSATWRTVASWSRLLNTQATGSFSVYWTANWMSMMFSSSVSISASAPCLLRTLSR